MTAVTYIYYRVIGKRHHNNDIYLFYHFLELIYFTLFINVLVALLLFVVIRKVLYMTLNAHVYFLRLK